MHKDVLFQAYFNACQVVLGPVGMPPSDYNPYGFSKNQAGFGTFGDPHFAAAVAEVATRALKAVWYQKWFVHRRLRPEAYGGLVYHRMNGVDYPVHPDVLNSQAVDEVRRNYGSHLLSQAFPEGSPLHPSYGAGHATVAGACVTILKALFCETYVIPEPMVPSNDGLRLELYQGPDADRMTLGGELNKLAANIAMGRNFAGIHWRSDYAESLRLGEQVAIHLLTDQRPHSASASMALHLRSLTVPSSRYSRGQNNQAQ